MTLEIRWAVEDKDGRPIYVTEERWRHIVERHPDMNEHEKDLKRTIQSGRRTQDSLVPNKYFYRQAVAGLSAGNTHIEAVVVFRFTVGDKGATAPNNFVITAYPTFMGHRR